MQVGSFNGPDGGVGEFFQRASGTPGYVGQYEWRAYATTQGSNTPIYSGSVSVNFPLGDIPAGAPAFVAGSADTNKYYYGLG